MELCYCSSRIKNLVVGFNGYSNQNPFFEGGTRWSGSSWGRSKPSSLTFMRCMAKANSSASNIPSLSTSDNFQILPRTLFGSFDLIISCLAEAPDTFPSIGLRVSKIESYLYLSLEMTHST